MTKAKAKKPVKKTAKKPVKKGGRPSKFSVVDLGQVEKLAKAGWTDEQMSAFYKVTRQTWHNWKKQHAKFFESLKDWKAEADHQVERALFQRATGYETTEERIVGHGEDAKVIEATKQFPPDTTACIFWLKNRMPEEWRDKTDHELSGPGGGPIQISDAKQKLAAKLSGK